MNVLLKKFQLEIDLLFAENNCVLGGSLALQAHGLLLDWQPDDIDIVVFNPTVVQEKFFDRYMQPCLDYSEKKKDVKYTNEKCMVYELVRDGLKMNCILHQGYMDNSYLLYNYKGKNYPINSIQAIINAKANHFNGDGKTHIRFKDVKHLQSLKNLNFNV